MRDTGILFALVQLTIAITARIVNLIDTGDKIPSYFPEDWVARHSSVLAIGPYYCVGALIFFAGTHPSLSKPLQEEFESANRTKPSVVCS